MNIWKPLKSLRVHITIHVGGKVRFGETPKPTRGTRVLPGAAANSADYEANWSHFAKAQRTQVHRTRSLTERFLLKAKPDFSAAP